MHTLTSHSRPQASVQDKRARRALGRHLEVGVLLSLGAAASAWSVRESESPEALSALLGLLPAVIGLQHGFVPALLAVGSTVAAVGCAAGITASTPLLSVMVAPFALALGVGQVRDRMRAKRDVLERRVAEQGRELEGLFRRHQLLGASHAQLEERLAASDWSLEAAVREATRRVAASNLSGAAGAVLELLAVQGRVGAASLYLARDGALSPRPDAELGPVGGHDARQRLVQRAFTGTSIVSLERYEPASTRAEDVLVALPIVDTDGTPVGVVAIHELPFVAFHEAHFQLLAALVAPFANALLQKLDEEETVKPIHLLPPPTKALAWLERESERRAARGSGVLALPSEPARGQAVPEQAHA